MVQSIPQEGSGQPILFPRSNSTEQATKAAIQSARQFPPPSSIFPFPSTIMATRPKHLPQLGSTTLDGFTIIPVPHQMTAGRLRYFSQNWAKLMVSNWIRNTANGYEIPPSLSVQPPSKWSTNVNQPAAEELSKLVQGAF